MGGKMTPAQQRVILARSRKLTLGSALIELQTRFSTPDSRTEFLAWRSNPITQLMVDALRELSATPPPGYLDTDSIPAQYGVSSGLSLGGNFVDDPTVLYPFLFTGTTPGAELRVPDTDYAPENPSEEPVGGATSKK